LRVIEFDIVSLSSNFLVAPLDKPPVRHYLNRNTSESFNRSLASQIDFRLSLDDLKAPWFFRFATRNAAHASLKGAPNGTFLIRPSSHRGLYALSWSKAGEVKSDDFSLLIIIFFFFFLFKDSRQYHLLVFSGVFPEEKADRWGEVFLADIAGPALSLSHQGLQRKSGLQPAATGGAKELFGGHVEAD
jgi:hypothetical protein